MPIKFRCHQCRQLLGISRSQAGEHVDCPQCGRSVQVPVPKGRKPRQQPLPKPASGLISALEELSSLSGSFDQRQTLHATTDVSEFQPNPVAVVETKRPQPELVTVDESDSYEPPTELEESLAELADFETAGVYGVSPSSLHLVFASRPESSP